MQVKTVFNTNNSSVTTLFILIVGFAILIALIVISGFVSAYQLSIIRSTVTSLEQDHLNQINTMIKIREIISQVYIEARETINLRRTNPSVKAFESLPFSLSVDLEKNLQVIEGSEIALTPEWKNFNNSLRQFIDTSIDPLYFQINGFEHQKLAFNTLDEVIKKIRSDRAKITQQTNAIQLKAEKYIVVTTAVSLAVGLLVAALAIIEIQKRFYQLQESFVTINQAREFNRDIINGVVNALFTLDMSGNLTSANQAFYDLLTLTSSTLGKPYQKIFDEGSDLYALIERVYKSMPNSFGYSGSLNLMTDGKVFKLNSYVTNFKVNDKIAGFIITLIDVTEMENVREERQRNQALAAIGQIAAQVAHEIKNPLGGIKLNLSYLKRNNQQNEEIKEVIDEISIGIDRLNKTVSELSNFVRPKQLILVNTDINSIIEQELSLVADKIKQKNINIVRNFQTDLPTLLADQHEISKAFINFLINAIEASDNSGKIEISTSKKGNKIIITITDSGKGMSKETLAHLFEPFFTTKATGTGLGMSIAKRVIEMHKGTLQVKSDLGKGTEIVVELEIKL
jgi:two-component system sensor histidine kinase HydH